MLVAQLRKILGHTEELSQLEYFLSRVLYVKFMFTCLSLIRISLTKVYLNNCIQVSHNSAEHLLNFNPR